MPKNEDSINALPEYEVRTMQGDINKIEGKPTDNGPVKLNVPVEKPEILKSKPLIETFKPPAPQKVSPPKELPIVTEKPKEAMTEFKPTPEATYIETQKASLPGVEELIFASSTFPKPQPPTIEPPKPEIPPIPMAPKAQTLPKIKPNRKINPKKIILIIFFLLAVIGLGAFFYWQGTKPEPEPKPQPPTNEVTIPASLIPVDQTKILKMDNNASLTDLIKIEASTEQPTQSIKRIIPMVSPGGEDKEILSLDELIQKLGIAIYPYVFSELTNNYTLILYTQNKEKLIGLVVETNNPANTKDQAKYWEPTMVEDLKNLFLFRKPGKPTTSLFKNNTYKEVSIRYINFPNPDLTIDYAILNNLFILSTSKEFMYNTIDRLKP